MPQPAEAKAPKVTKPDPEQLAASALEFGDLYNMLSVMVRRDSQPSSDGEKVRHKREIDAPIPLHAEVFDLRTKLVKVSETWADRVAGARSMTYVKSYGLANQDSRLHRAIDVLVSSSTWVVEQTWARSCADEIETVRGRARRVIGLDARAIRVPMPCPECDMVALIRRDGWGFIRCAKCGVLVAEDTYQVLVRGELWRQSQTTTS